MGEKCDNASTICVSEKTVCYGGHCTCEQGTHFDVDACVAKTRASAQFTISETKMQLMAAIIIVVLLTGVALLTAHLRARKQLNSWIGG